MALDTRCNSGREDQPTHRRHNVVATNEGQSRVCARRHAIEQAPVQDERVRRLVAPHGEEADQDDGDRGNRKRGAKASESERERCEHGGCSPWISADGSYGRTDQLTVNKRS